MIIINDKKLIKQPKQKEVLDHLKRRSKNNYYIDWVVRNFISCDVVSISYCFKIDNIIYPILFHTYETTDDFDINKTERYIEGMKYLAVYWRKSLESKYNSLFLKTLRR